MLVNLRAAGEKRELAKKAEYYLMRTKEKTGRSFQNILAEAVVFRVNKGAESDAIYKEIIDEYEQLSNV